MNQSFVHSFYHLLEVTGSYSLSIINIQYLLICLSSVISLIYFNHSVHFFSTFNTAATCSNFELMSTFFTFPSIVTPSTFCRHLISKLACSLLLCFSGKVWVSHAYGRVGITVVLMSVRLTHFYSLNNLFPKVQSLWVMLFCGLLLLTWSLASSPNTGPRYFIVFTLSISTPFTAVLCMSSFFIYFCIYPLLFL